VEQLAKRTKIKKTSYQAVLEKPKPLKLPKYAKKRPEGFLFPDTYELTADSTATSTLKQMVTQYKSVAREIEFEAAAKKLKRSPYEVLIVASIIEREVNKEEYRPKVARVLYNRLDKGMKLGCGYPMGPFTLLDFVGLDTTYYIANIMFEEFREPAYAPPPLLKRMVLAGRMGRKSGHGFYQY